MSVPAKGPPWEKTIGYIRRRRQEPGGKGRKATGHAYRFTSPGVVAQHEGHQGKEDQGNIF
eukprot:6603196-Heterocapsa_arctica.AAC.1